jgi:hypothetical protein
MIEIEGVVSESDWNVWSHDHSNSTQRDLLDEISRHDLSTAFL